VQAAENFFGGVAFGGQLVDACQRGFDRGLARLAACQRGVGCVGAQSYRVDDGGKGHALTHERHEHDQVGAEQEQIASGELGAAAGAEGEGKDGGECDHPPGARPGHDQHLAVGKSSVLVVLAATAAEARVQCTGQ
jgi:hypothetical protein